MKKSIIVILVVLILITSIITVYLSLKFGIKTGMTIGAIVFIMLGGFELLWYLATYKSCEENVKEYNKKEKATFLKKSENNPTLR
jgi:hypothetical protein